LSKPKAKRQDLLDPIHGPVFTVRFLLALVLMVGGIAWIAYYYLAVRVDPAVVDAKAGGPAFMADLVGWNYVIGFGALMLGLVVSAHPMTPLGRGRGVAPAMLTCFLVGLVWICTFYVFSDRNPIPVPVMDDLGQKNLLVGIAFMAVGFAFATRWE
jgi:hypothetical protein